MNSAMARRRVSPGSDAAIGQQISALRRNSRGFFEPELLIALAVLALVLGFWVRAAGSVAQPLWISIPSGVALWLLIVRATIFRGWSDKAPGIRQSRISPTTIVCLVVCLGGITDLVLHSAGRMTNRLLGMRLNANPFGWDGQLKGAPRVFDQPLLVRFETRETPDDTWLRPPVTRAQATLFRRIQPQLSVLMDKAERALIADNRKNPNFGLQLTNAHLWFPAEQQKDGRHWSLVIERTDNRSFGYHVEFDGLELLEVWAGD